MYENMTDFEAAPEQESPWQGSCTVWRVLDALAPPLLLQPIVSIPGGLKLVHTDVLVLMDAVTPKAPAIAPHTANIRLAQNGSDLFADIRIPEAPMGMGCRQLSAARPWVDPETGALWFMNQSHNHRRRHLGPFVRVGPDGIHPTTVIPALDLIALELGFDSVRLRLDALKAVL